MKLAFVFLILFTAVQCYSQDKIIIFAHLGRDKSELRKENARGVYSFNGGYVRSRWNPGTYGPCQIAEITFTTRPDWDADIIAMTDAPKGELVPTAKGQSNAQYLYKTDTKTYAVRLTGNEFIDTVVIAVYDGGKSDGKGK